MLNTVCITAVLFALFSIYNTDVEYFYITLFFNKKHVLTVFIQR